MSDNGKLSEYFAYRQTTKLLLYATGLWPLRNPSVFYRYLSYTCILVISIPTFAILGFILHHITRVSIVVKGMSAGTSLISGIIKIVCILIYRERAIELHYVLNDRFSAGLSDKRLSKLILAGITTLRRLSWILIPTVSLTLGVYIVTPAMSIIHQKRQNIEPVQYSLIYPGLYPWNISTGIIYQIHFIIETLAALSMICITCGVDSLFAYYVFQMIGQLRSMSYRLTHTDDKEDIEVVIKQCVEEYGVLLQCRDSVQKIFGPIILWMMWTNAVILCALIFQLSQQIKNISMGGWILIISYIILKVVQTYMYSWSGSSLITQFEKYRQAIYAVDWFSKRDVMCSIVIMLSQRPLNLKVCKFWMVSVDMFIMILNTTASYYFLLRTLEQKS